MDIPAVFASVFLNEPKKYIVIPRAYIYELSDVDLCNNGINTHQDRRFYFSSKLYEACQNGEILLERDILVLFPPNFHLAETKEYPLPNILDETCFIGQLRKFWGK